MKVGVVGVGEMGAAMAGHLAAKGHEVSAYDIDRARLEAIGRRGISVTSSLQELAKKAELFIVIVSTDEQSREVTEDLSLHARDGALIAIVATNTKEGTLLSLCGGDESDVAFARPALMAYSRNVLRVGPVGAGQLAKACNNLLHWAHCVSNYETLLIAKRFGIDAQKMREVLLECPAFNLTLKRWDTTKFTWQEKDMDVTMELAQMAGLSLPLAGQIDQLVKLLSAADVKALLYGDECSYLGRKISPMSVEEGGLV